MMVIDAVRLREVGSFREGVALEELSSGLNVLLGPNELGKSTIFAALRLLFEQTYTAKNEAVRRLVPSNGGAPEIECDFSADGRRWRLRKKFVAGRGAKLLDLDHGKLLRGGDVQPVLDKIIQTALGDAMLLPLLWVDQGESFEPPQPAQRARETLEDLLRDEAEAASGASQLVAIHERVSQDLFSLITEKTRKPKKGSALARAINACETCRVEAEALRERALASAERRAARKDLLARVSRNSDVATRQAADGSLAELKARHSAAADARAKADLVDAEVRRLATEMQRADEKLAQAKRLVSSLAEIEQVITDSAGSLAAARADREAAAAAHSEAAADFRAVSAKREALQIERVAAERAARRQADLQRHLALVEHIDAARKAQTAMAAARVDAERISVTQENLAQLREIASAIRSLEAEVAATSARMTIEYEPGSSGGIIVDGVPAEDGTNVLVEGIVRVAIPGIGSVTIESGSRGETLAPSARLARAKEELSDGLLGADVPDLETAAQNLERKTELLNRAREQRLVLNQLAPDGLNALEQAAAELAQQLEAVPVDDTEVHDNFETRWADVEAVISSSQATLDTATERWQQSRDAEARIVAERDGYALRRRELEDEFSCPPEERAGLLEKLERYSRQAASDHHAAVRDRAAWLDAAPSTEALTELGNEIVAKELQQRSRDEELARLRQELSAVEGALARDMEDGIEARAAQAEEALAAAQEELHRIERDVGALALLEGELARARADQSSRTVGPIVQRLRALVCHSIGDFDLSLNEQLQITGVERELGQVETRQLSGGTREQIAVLARLAFAGLIAEKQSPFPVVLDDVLVFSDDARLEKMFDALAAAAARHQIIVLSCHDRSFAPLIARHGGRRLELKPWREPGEIGD